MRQRLFFLSCLLLTLAFAPALGAASFEVSAAVDRNEVELGEPLRYTLTLQVSGRMDFPVSVETPKFDGFQASQPMRSDSSSWVNGAVTEQHSFSWELIPIKAGSVTLPPVKANAKDALNGEVNKSTAAITITVKRPKNAYNASAAQPNMTPLPTYALQPQQQDEQAQQPQGPDDQGLRDIKADRGLPWLRLGAVFGAFAGVLALLVWWAKRPAEEEPTFVPVRDPRSNAFRLLDAALERLKVGDEKGFALGVGQALRGYLRQRMDLRHEATLAEAVFAGRRRLPDQADKDEALELCLRLQVLLYGDAKFVEADKALLDQASRRLIDTMERLAGR